MPTFYSQNIYANILLTKYICLLLPLKIGYISQLDEYKLPKKALPLIVSDFFELKCNTLLIHLKKEQDIQSAHKRAYSSIQCAVDKKQLLPAPPFVAHFDIQYDLYQAHLPSVSTSTGGLHLLFNSINFSGNVRPLDAKAYRTARSQLISVPMYLTKVPEVR
jgi:hypothetical protein